MFGPPANMLGMLVSGYAGHHATSSTDALTQKMISDLDKKVTKGFEETKEEIAKIRADVKYESLQLDTHVVHIKSQIATFNTLFKNGEFNKKNADLYFDHRYFSGGKLTKLTESLTGILTCLKKQNRSF